LSSENFRKREQVKSLPLSGIRVLVGRARHQASALSGELRRLGAEVIEIPLIEIRKPKSFEPLDEALRHLGSYDWLVLTSVNGVEAMWERMANLKLAPDLVHVRIVAIGPATQKAIEQHGLKVDVVPKEYVAESVVRSLRRRVKGKRVLLVRAKVARDVIPRELREAGALVDVVEAYETIVPESSRRRLQSLLTNSRRRPHVVTFTSSSTVKNFAELLGGMREMTQLLRTGNRHGEQAMLLASIGPVTSSTLRDLGLRMDVEAQEYTIPGLIEAIVNALKAQ
jgi:uroporphyrinogen-III synthase